MDIGLGGVSCIGVGLLFLFGDSIRNPSWSYKSCSEKAIDMAAWNSMSQSHYRYLQSRVLGWPWFFGSRKSCLGVLTTAIVSGMESENKQRGRQNG